MNEIEHTYENADMISARGGKMNVSKAITYYLESATELFEAEVPESNSYEWNYKRKLVRGYGWFNGNYTDSTIVADAIEQLQEPLWEPVFRKRDMLKAPLNEKAVAREVKRRRRRTKGDSGNDLNIHDVMQGRLDRAWTRTEMQERETHASKHVTLLVNCSMSSMVGAAKAEWRSAALLQVLDELTRLGKSVELAFYWSTHRSFRDAKTSTCFFYVPIKKAGEQMSAKHVAVYSSASFIRLYTLNKLFNLVGRPVTSGYGTPFSSYSALPYPAMEMKKKGHHVVVLSQCFNKEAAESAIDKVIQQVKDKDAMPTAMSVKQQLAM